MYAQGRSVDARYYQIAILAALLSYGVLRLDFDIAPARVALLVAATLAAQWVCAACTRRPLDARSALISGLSLCLLLRTSSDLVALAAAALTIGSKFLIRIRGKHVFNPTNFGIVAVIAITGNAWVSPGQWATPSSSRP